MDLKAELQDIKKPYALSFDEEMTADCGMQQLL